MILIADSGSTKTDWRLIDGEGKIHQYKTIGLNPFFNTSEEITEKLNRELVSSFKQIKPEQIEKVFFYGAGCSTVYFNSIAKKGIEQVFPKAKVEIEHDLLAAARALCGREPGIAAILGTGSNSCLYDGEKITDNVTALGFMLGDEGSGTHMGKQLIRDYFYRNMPQEIRSNFEHRFKLDKDEIFQKVYQQELPNRYLASFSKFIFQNIEHEYAINLVKNSLTEFIKEHITKYEDYQQFTLNVVGSIGFYYSRILKEVAEEKGITVGTLVETPIAALTTFHVESEI